MAVPPGFEPGVSAFGGSNVVHDRDRIGTNLLYCALTPEAPRIAATPGPAASLRLLLEARHRFWIGPAGAGQIAVMLIAVFLQPALHMAVGLMATHRSPLHCCLHRWWPAKVLTLAGLEDRPVVATRAVVWSSRQDSNLHGPHP